MQLFIDGKSTRFSAEQNATVDELLEEVRAVNGENHRAIVGLVCDGMDAFGEALTATLSRSAADFARIDVETGRLADLVGETLDGILGALEEVDTARVNVVDLFGESKQREAMTRLSDCVRQWNQINMAVIRCMGLIPVSEMLSKEEQHNITHTFESVRDAMSNTKTAIESQDFVSLADILEYEIPDVSRKWRSVIDSLKSCLG